jgi:hypothetical protein
MKAITADPSKRLDIYARKDCSFDKEFTIVNSSDQSEFDLTGYTFVLYVFDSFLKAPKLTITESNGITITDNVIGISIDKSLLDFKKEDNFYFLEATIDGKKYVWLNGNFTVNHGLFDGVQETEQIEINLAADEITIEISMPGGSGSDEHFLGKYVSLAALETAHATGEDGDFAIVDPGAGTDALQYIWDAEEGWVASGAPSAPDTFDADFVVTVGTGQSFGQFANGETVPAEGLTAVEVLLLMAGGYNDPAFTSFLITGQSTMVEVGTTISGSKTFTWAITENSGDVNVITIYDVTAVANLLVDTANDGSQAVTVTSNQLNANGSTQVFRGILKDANNANNQLPSSNFTITSRFYRFFGPASSAPTNSAEVRALASSSFQTSNSEVFTLNTGDDETIFAVALPPGRTISSVIDLDASNTNVTADYTLTVINVQDAGGTNRSYNVYICTNAIPYSSNHRHQITTA